MSLFSYFLEPLFVVGKAGLLNQKDVIDLNPTAILSDHYT